MADRGGRRRAAAFTHLWWSDWPGGLGEQVPEAGLGEPDPAMLAIDAEQDLRYRQTNQFGL